MKYRVFTIAHPVEKRFLGCLTIFADGKSEWIGRDNAQFGNRKDAALILWAYRKCGLEIVRHAARMSN